MGLLITIYVLVGSYATWMFLYTEAALRFHDRYRIKGDANYTNTAILVTKIAACIVALICLFLIIFTLIVYNQ